MAVLVLVLAFMAVPVFAYRMGVEAGRYEEWQRRELPPRT